MRILGITTALIRIEYCPVVIIQHCHFHKNTAAVLQTSSPFNRTSFGTVIIQNTSFTDNKFELWFIRIVNSKLILKGPIVFRRNSNSHDVDGGPIFQLHNSTFSAKGYIEFSNNYAMSITVHYCIREYECFYWSIADNTTINITSNIVNKYFIGTFKLHPSENIKRSVCYFQYYTARRPQNGVLNSNISVMIISNRYKESAIYDIISNKFALVRNAVHFDYQLHTTHCIWLPPSALDGIIPTDVNKQHVTYTNNSKTLPGINQTKLLCHCEDETRYNCYTEDLGYLYPRHTLALLLHYHGTYTFKVEVIADFNITHTYFTPCVVYNAKEHKQLVASSCTKLNYTIAFPTGNWCELILKLPQVTPLEYSIFYIRQLPCPLGFMKINGICQCYPSFKLFGITNCDINTQTILRPANTWSSAITNYSYYISQHCPFHYCIPYPFHLNLSTPDTQCQFNRSGLLCGQCQHGLSTVFGSSYCKQCSSLYLTLIIPIGIAGLLLVLLLFLLNLTVTDGSINAFILYVNIISINSTVFFPHQHNVSPAYIFISLANLDLGIQTCFYNGMDDYAKMWLQLTFPFYLIFLATLLIITSRYSTTIQRLTANRALPVLATLFLLSYTKILRTVSSVLFFY